MQQLRVAFTLVLALASTSIVAAPRPTEGHLSAHWGSAVPNRHFSEFAEAPRQLEPRSDGGGSDGAADRDGSAGKWPPRKPRRDRMTLPPMEMTPEQREEKLYTMRQKRMHANSYGNREIRDKAKARRAAEAAEAASAGSSKQPSLPLLNLTRMSAGTSLPLLNLSRMPAGSPSQSQVPSGHASASRLPPRFPFATGSSPISTPSPALPPLAPFLQSLARSQVASTPPGRASPPQTSNFLSNMSTMTPPVPSRSTPKVSTNLSLGLPYNASPTPSRSSSRSPRNSSGQ